MSNRNGSRESFLIRIWTEPGDAEPVMRGLIQNVQTGHKTYFQDVNMPIGLLRESVERLAMPATASRAALR